MTVKGFENFLDTQSQSCIKMPHPREPNQALMEEVGTFPASQQDWSILKAANVLLSDPVSFYEDHQDQMFSNTDYGFSAIVEETQPKFIKTEPAELLPSDFHQSGWQSKYIDYWKPEDCLFWLIHELQELKVAQALPAVKMEGLAHIDGVTLKNMTLDEFRCMFPEYGLELYNRLQRLKSSVNNFYSFDQWNNNAPVPEESFTRYSTPTQDPHMLTDLDDTRLPTFANNNHHHHEQTIPYNCSPPARVLSEMDSGYKSDCSEESIPEPPPPPPEKRRPGRPRGTRKKKKPEKIGRVWEFLRDLLLDSSYRHVISWEDREQGVFRFQNSAEAAKLWGDKRANSNMDFKKFSRAMRHNYKMGYLKPVEKSKLVYRFGHKSQGWKPEQINNRVAG